MSSHFIGGVQAFSMRIMSINSLPDACVSLMTFDIIFLSIAPWSLQSSKSDHPAVLGKN